MASSGIRFTQPMFKVEMLILKSKANIDVKILFGKITHLLNPELGISRRDVCEGEGEVAVFSAKR